jgi:hypothetical protein
MICSMATRLETAVTISGLGQACHGLGLSLRRQLVYGVQAVRFVPDVRCGNLTKFGQKPCDARRAKCGDFKCFHVGRLF